MDKGLRRIESTDVRTIQTWRVKHGLSIIPVELFPKIGLMCENSAAGFMYVAEGIMAIPEFFISNPAANYRDRYRAFLLIAEALFNHAELLGCKLIHWDTKNRVFKKKAREFFGFKDLGSYSVLIKEIK